MLITALLFLTTLFVAYANGANDNFKGVATLFGSDTATYRGAIVLATITTFAGALGCLLCRGAGARISPAKDSYRTRWRHLPASSLPWPRAGATVILATLLGMPSPRPMR